MDSKQGNNSHEETMEPTSMSWCYSPTNILHGLEDDRMQSTPSKSITLEGQYMNKDNNDTLGGTDNSQSIV